MAGDEFEGFDFEAAAAAMQQNAVIAHELAANAEGVGRQEAAEVARFKARHDEKAATAFASGEFGYHDVNLGNLLAVDVTPTRGAQLFGSIQRLQGFVSRTRNSVQLHPIAEEITVPQFFDHRTGSTRMLIDYGPGHFYPTEREDRVQLVTDVYAYTGLNRAGIAIPGDRGSYTATVSPMGFTVVENNLNVYASTRPRTRRPARP